MTTEKPSKSNLKIVLISVLLLSLAALSVSAFVFKDKIFGQNKNETSKVSVQSQNDITNTNAADGPAKVTSTTQNLLNTPLLIIQGSGYGKSIEAFNADTNADRIYPNVNDILLAAEQRGI